MSKSIITACAAITVFTMPALADDARTPPSDPYFAPAAQACEDMDLTIYFEPGQSELSPFARGVLRETHDQLSGCAVTAITGLASANDADIEADKLTLAAARRTAIMEALDSHGIRAVNANLKMDVSAAPQDAVMARNVKLTLKTVPAQVG